MTSITTEQNDPFSNFRDSEIHIPIQERVSCGTNHLTHKIVDAGTELLIKNYETCPIMAIYFYGWQC